MAALARAMTALLTDAVRYPRDDIRTWVPIGPSVVRPDDRWDFWRTSGRVRDLAVSEDGRRAYAAAAKGGLWYTDDGAATWTPVGGWAGREGVRGGTNSPLACSALLVLFGRSAAEDFVLVGTGEDRGATSIHDPDVAGIGVLAACAPAGPGRTGADDPWETESGVSVFEGQSIFRLAEKPGEAMSVDGCDVPRRVLAATGRGLVLGTRSPGGDQYLWTAFTSLTSFAGYTTTDDAGATTPSPPVVCDVLWLPRGDNGRIVVSLAPYINFGDEPGSGESGVAYSDDLGTSFRWIEGLNPMLATEGVLGRTSLAHVDGRLYVLGARDVDPMQRPVATVWRVPAIADAEPVATQVRGVPEVWRFQRDYDQAITAVSGTSGSTTFDRIYLGGDWTTNPAADDRIVASLWCLQTRTDGDVVWLDPVPGVSRAGEPPVGDGSGIDGLIGFGVHADVHVIRVVGQAGRHHVWVGCDGGVFVSSDAGRVSTFAPKVMGMAALEVNLLAAHPTSSQCVAIGTQDNGVQVRTGDVVWQIILGGDGGGVAFHPYRSHFIIFQGWRSDWVRLPEAHWESPVDYMSEDRTRERDLSHVYSGCAIIPDGTDGALLAIGTNRVWVSDNVGRSDRPSWGVLPYPSGDLEDPRHSGDPMATWNMGVPQGGPLAPAVFGEGPLGPVICVRWVSPTHLLALFDFGVVRWIKQRSGQWDAFPIAATAAAAATPPVGGVPPLGAGAPDPNVAGFSDIFPVPASLDFYLTTTGNPDTADDTCYHYSDADTAFAPTGLRRVLGPVNPAYAVVVDPADHSTVYVGTASGVWRGSRAVSGSHTWQPMVNGLPQALIQDLNIWVDPSGAPRLLRAAVQSRGVWETDLATVPQPARTYLRVHAHDDRRRFPTPLANPRRPPWVPDLPTIASPDIVVRPQSWPRPTSADAPPTWQLGDRRLRATSDQPYELWTFQTAFRWLYPSLLANGLWSDALGDLVRRHRLELGLSNEVIIDRALWDAVVGREASPGRAPVVGTRLDPTTHANSDDPAHPRAVYRAPWHTRMAPDVAATEIDLLECVVPPRGRDEALWHVYREPSTVEVLVHHRATRAVPAHEAFVVLLLRDARSRAGAVADAAAVPAYVAGVLAAEHAAEAPATAPPPGPLPPNPSGWTPVLTSAGRALHRVPVPVDARMPRSVSINVDLGTVGNGRHVALLAVAGSRVDLCATPPVGLPASADATDLVTRWPYAALRVVRVSNRPR